MAMKSCVPSASCASACSGVRTRLAAMTGILTCSLTAFARYLRQPGGKLMGSQEVCAVS